jgi:hypothetical protein
MIEAPITKIPDKLLPLEIDSEFYKLEEFNGTSIRVPIGFMMQKIVDCWRNRAGRVIDVEYS